MTGTPSSDEVWAFQWDQWERINIPPAPGWAHLCEREQDKQHAMTTPDGSTTEQATDLARQAWPDAISVMVEGRPGWGGWRVGLNVPGRRMKWSDPYESSVMAHKQALAFVKLCIEREHKLVALKASGATNRANHLHAILIALHRSDP